MALSFMNPLINNVASASNLIKSPALSSNRGQTFGLRGGFGGSNTTSPISLASVGVSNSKTSNSDSKSNLTVVNSAPSARTVGSTSPTVAVDSDYKDILDQIRSVTNETNAYNQAQAAAQRDWQVQQNKIAMDFNAAEAAKNRDWQAYMSNTAHQREVADLKAAGLNPILSASGGNGAPVSSGATASGVTSSGAKSDADTSMNMALLNLLNNVMGYATQTAVAGIGAGSAVAVQQMKQDYDKWAYENQPTSAYSALFGSLNNPDSKTSKVSNLMKSLKSFFNNL